MATMAAPERVRIEEESPYLLYQCPGCWGHSSHRGVTGGWIQCNCGERMTLVDLRARTEDGLHARFGVDIYEDES